ncbi:LamG domain-containing protein [Agaribacterium sp. ZY112]|uniref:LamG domain-containing protein n=1 Tax=Agaribacterium sp. ZY112 TaxID=3233574 RepID=UPI003524F9A2
MKVIKIVASLSLLATVAACSSGSGEGVQANAQGADDGRNSGLVYKGPAPSTDDVQNFKINVWDNLATSDRCGACHIEGEQSPMFVRTDDINLAYAEANKLVDLGAPPLSRLVTKVQSGHNCWSGEPNVCADIITNYIENWASASGAEPNAVVLVAPPEIEIGQSKNFPLDSALFSTTVYPVLTSYCVDCHSEDSATKQQPYLASADIDVAYQAAKSRMKLDNPASSRLVNRLGFDSHNCWSNCAANASTMEEAIQALADGIPTTEVDPALVVSRALSLPDGIVASSGGRVESAAIALYEFKTGEGAIAFDTSGVEPALDLNLSGDYEWVGSWGVRINDGKAQGATSTSSKLYDLISSTGEFSVEAWLIPDNVAQDGPARIVTYSGGPDDRNFTLGQTTYDYDFLVRHSEAEGAGGDQLSTPSEDEVLQATLQHVVVNFDPINGQSIFVNGELVAEDTEQVGNLADWDPTYALAVGNEVDNAELWMGTMRLLAIHNRKLSVEDITENFEAGVGEKFFLLFGLSHLIDVPEAYIVFEVQQYDNYGYLFTEPFFISLDNSTVPDDLRIQGLRLGLNGREVATGQAYANLDITINSENYSSAAGTSLGRLGALIPLEQGADIDQFFLSFDSIAGRSYARPAEPVPERVPLAAVEEQSEIGVRTFDEVNLNLSQMTGVATDEVSVKSVFDAVRQQMPVDANPQAFLASHQSGVMQLSVAYCTALVQDNSLRSQFWPGFDFGASYAAAFNAAGREIIVGSLMKALISDELDYDGLTVSLATQPDPADVEMELNNLIDNMAGNGNTQTTVIASCSAALGSALMLVQ